MRNFLINAIGTGYVSVALAAAACRVVDRCGCDLGLQCVTHGAALTVSGTRFARLLNGGEQMATEIIATYDMKEDAMGLADFITQNLDNQECPVVYVETSTGAQCVKAEWVADTLTDGSVAYNLRLTFD